MKKVFEYPKIDIKLFVGENVVTSSTNTLDAVNALESKGVSANNITVKSFDALEFTF